MSIHSFLDKIKGSPSSNRTPLMYALIVGLVGVCAFGLGRLSSDGPQNPQNSPVTIENGQYMPDIDSESLGEQGIAPITHDEQPSIAGKNYVASKNGKLYYPKGCSGASRIAVKNEVWFATAEEAEESGFTASASCK